MSITIYNPRIIADNCKTLELHHRHMDTIDLPDSSLPGLLESVVRGNDVIELGCGVFGGIAKHCLDAGCASYTGVDMSVGNSREMQHQIFKGEKMFSFDKVPCVITIPKEVAEHPLVNFFYGIDFGSYLSQLPDNRYVTVSTGFFHDYLLTPENVGKEYIDEALMQLCRITKPGERVGFHQFLYDVYGVYKGSRATTFGKFFKDTLEKHGVNVTLAEKHLYYVYLSKA